MNHSSVIFPSEKNWITPRTDLGQLTTENCAILLNQRIDSLNKILVNTSTGFVVKVTNGQQFQVPFSEIYSDYACTQKIFEVVNITKYVVEESKYRTLNKVNVFTIESASEGRLYLNNTWFYSHNSKSIMLPNERFNISQYTTDLILIWSLFDLFNKYSTIYMKVYNDGSAPLVFNKDSLELANPTVSSPILTKWQFRVYYTPLGESVKLQANKTNPQPKDFIIPFSQTQQIVDNISHGREMQSLTNRTGCEKHEVVRVLHNISEYRDPYKGYYVREKDSQGNYTGNIWRLTKVQHKIYSPTLIIVMETWSKNWSVQSENVPINREFRSWNIPADIVQRNLHYNDYCLLTQRGKLNFPVTDGNDCIMSAAAKKELFRGLTSSYNAEKLTECNNLWFYRSDGTNVKGAVMSCSSFGFGNSLVFCGKTKDNLSAGVQRVPSNSSDKNYQFCKDVYYCDDDGTLETMSLQVGAAIYSSPEVVTEESYLYPEVKNVINGNAVSWYNTPDEVNGIVLFDAKTHVVKKSPVEQLNFTYQLHLMTDDPLLVIGSTWLNSCPLVKERKQTTPIKVWRLTKMLPTGAQIITADYGTVETDAISLFYQIDIDNGIITFNSGAQGTGVCISDENNNVLIAYNGKTKATFTANFTHFYETIYKTLKTQK